MVREHLMTCECQTVNSVGQTRQAHYFSPTNPAMRPLLAPCSYVTIQLGNYLPRFSATSASPRPMRSCAPSFSWPSSFLPKSVLWPFGTRNLGTWNFGTARKPSEGHG